MGMTHENLPAKRDADVEEAVFEGEIVDDEPQARPAVVVQVSQTINVVVQHPAVRHASYPVAGAVVAWRRWQRRRSLSQDMAQQANMAGDRTMALQFLQHAELERKGRHDRRMQRSDQRLKWLKALPVAAAMALILMAAVNVLLFIATRRAANLAWSFVFAAHAVQLGIEIAAVLAWVLAFGVPVAVFTAFYRLGRRGDELAPGWSTAAKPDAGDKGLVVTADAIVRALQHTPVTELKKAFKDGWQPAFTLPPIRDGEGYSALFSLPMGVTASMVADQVEVFARNLHRAKTEVWVTDAERAKIAPAGYVSLWVANPGVLDRPAPEYPLLHEGQADVFEGVPGGIVARGDGVLVPVAGKNVVVGGQMGEGKSNTCRVYLLGCCTDPLCEVDAFVFANNGDFDAFAPRLANYFKGTEDDTVIAAVNRLQYLYEEVGRREGRLAELGAKKLTRRIAEQHPDMRPVVSLYSECHELFGHPEYGELAGELATKIAKRARKTGIVLVFDTQSSRKEAIPPKLVELMSVNACFYVKKWQSNDGFLGDGAFQAGIRATELRPGRDRGRSVITGISDAQFELLKWYFIVVDDDTGYDAAAEVIERCMTTVAPGTPVAGSIPAAIEVRDLLADLDAVIDGFDRVKVNDLPQRLRKIAPTWAEYRSLNGVQLRERLMAEGVRTIKAGNVPLLDPADLHHAIAAREAEG